MSLVEMLVGLGLSLVGFVIAYKLYTDGTVQAKRTGAAQDDESQRRLVRQSIGRTVGEALGGRVWLNAGVRARLGLGDAAWSGHSDAVQSLLVLRGTTLGNVVTTSPGSYQIVAAADPSAYDVIAAIGKDSEAPATTLAARAQLPDAVGNFQITVTADDPAYAVGDSIAISAPNGTQILELVGKAAPGTTWTVHALGTYQVRIGNATRTTAAPVRFIDPGSPVFRPKTTIIGYEPPRDRLTLLRSARGVISALPAFVSKLKRAQVADTSGAPWTPVAPVNIRPLVSRVQLRMTWDRPALGANGNPVAFLDIGL
jgi:hypothetical protein